MTAQLTVAVESFGAERISIASWEAEDILIKGCSLESERPKVSQRPYYLHAGVRKIHTFFFSLTAIDKAAKCSHR